MISRLVPCRGVSRDPQQFQDNYKGQHASFLRRFPNIRLFILRNPTKCADPIPVAQGDT